MRIGIVGPPEIVDKIQQIVQREFLQIEPIPYIYDVYTEAPSLLANEQPHLDALLFAGATTLAYAEKHLKSTVPWDCVPQSGSSLLRVLLQIALSEEHSIYRISSDIYASNQLSEAYEEVGIDPNRFQIYAVDKPPADEDYIDYVCSFHEHHYLSGQASCCITALYNVHKRLTAQGIPCFRIDPTANVIRQALHKMQLNYLVQTRQQTQLVALCVRIDAPHEYSLFNDNEYQYIIDKTNATRQIYLFAQRLQAAVAEIGAREFLLFSTKELLEAATNNFEKVDLLQAVKQNTASTVSLGIGYGKTAQEAKSSAALGMERADSLGGDMAFIVYNGSKIIGPLRSHSERQPSGGIKKVDKKFLAVCEKTGISINTVFQLHSIVEREGKTRFTPAELADLAGVTPRTMNRVLAKLIAHDFCFEVGKKVLGQAGRPSRIVELHIP